MEKKYFVVTNPENGWDCVLGIFCANSKQEVMEYVYRTDLEDENLVANEHPDANSYFDYVGIVITEKGMIDVE